MCVVLINATAAKVSGALTILKDCVAYLQSVPENGIEYHFCTVVDDFDSSKNVRIHKIKPKNWLARIEWDNGGLQKWCVRMGIKPDLIISLQNTSTKYSNSDGKCIPQIVYYHQPLPLVSYNWNIFNRKEIVLFLYAHYYAFFVKMHNKSSYYVVQLPFIRELFLKKFKKVKRDNVFVIRPNNPLIDVANIPEIPFDHDLFTFFYPATALKYKNHSVLIQALVLLREKYSSVLNKIKIIFTVEALESKLMKLIQKHNLSDIIQLIGKKSYDEILSYYKSVNALLFPSKIETFGLPLAEATCFELPIISADLPYAHEALENYSNKIFISPEDVNAWANIIQNYTMYEKISLVSSPNSSTYMYKNSWRTFFDLAGKILNDTESNLPRKK
jgi:glycosyltransferase involved in cell wall biosynthesis